MAHRLEDVREALALPTDIPIMACDARDRESTKNSLIALTEHAMRTWKAANVVPH